MFPINASNSTNAAAGAAAGQNQSAAQSSGLSRTANTQTFLQLLVAQIKNQNPLDPTDSTQFVAQLAQFSQLEQTMNIQKDVAALRQDLESWHAAAENPPQTA